MTDLSFPPDWAPDTTFADGRIGLTVRDGIAVLAVQIPQKMNALDVHATRGMVEALEAAQDQARVLLFTGTGAKRSSPVQTSVDLTMINSKAAASWSGRKFWPTIRFPPSRSFAAIALVAD